MDKKINKNLEDQLDLENDLVVRWPKPLPYDEVKKLDYIPMNVHPNILNVQLRVDERSFVSEYVSKAMKVYCLMLYDSNITFKIANELVEGFRHIVIDEVSCENYYYVTYPRVEKKKEE